MKDFVISVKGCNGCLFLEYDDTDIGASCKVGGQNNYIELTEMNLPITPEWCVLKKKKVVIEMSQIQVKKVVMGQSPSVWQNCPRCEGTGVESYMGISLIPCTVCEGKKIISTQTGRPPDHPLSNPEQFQTCYP